jgi:hypothetical protein
MTEDRLREVLQQMRNEPVPPDSLARVRLAVAERTAPRRGPWYAFAAVAALLFILVGVLLQQRPERPALAPPPMPVIAHAPAPVPVPPVRAIRQRRAMPRPRPNPTVASTVVRIETADPNVVILLVSDGAGE